MFKFRHVWYAGVIAIGATILLLALLATGTQYLWRLGKFGDPTPRQTTGVDPSTPNPSEQVTTADSQSDEPNVVPQSPLASNAESDRPPEISANGALPSNSRLPASCSRLALPQQPPAAAVDTQTVTSQPPLRRMETRQLPAGLGLDQQLWSQGPGQRGDRAVLLRAIDHSLKYLNTAQATETYRTYPVSQITREKVILSLNRFRQLVQSSRSPQALQAAIQQEFEFYQAAGHDGKGTVIFTGYFEPTYQASPEPTQEYRFPLFRRPTDYDQWPKPHPTRLQLEGRSGLAFGQSRLQGMELVWLRDRLEAYLVQVQGSARLEMTDGTPFTVGYAGHTDHPYVSLGKELIKDGLIRKENLNLPNLINFFKHCPTALDEYIPRNNRFVFFQNTQGSAPTGSLGLPVMPERSVATDKSLMPPGALGLVSTSLPFVQANGKVAQQFVNRYVLDQDTGGAIRGPGRVDIFMGTGSRAGTLAGLINSEGQFYYLLLKN